MPGSRLEYLFNCYVNNSAGVQEDEELMELIAQPENKIVVQKLIDRFIEDTGSEISMSDQAANAILQNILQVGQENKRPVVPINKRSVNFKIWIRVAAVIILFIGAASAYWVLNKNDGKQKAIAQNKKLDAILPGGNRAVLTTSDGSTILLDSIQNGTIANKGAAKISKQGGMLIYNLSSSNPDAAVIYNTLSTPKGGQYQVILSDGSKVWLNAASSLRFPSAFHGRERVVELTGEAYFEVAKNKEKSFQVRAADMKVNVLGTHFNINAYPDESGIRTSLLEGSVRITTGNSGGILKPGQQAVLNNKESGIVIANANLDEVMAWKNGLFQFDGADITSIMREIGRWYNVEIVYEGKVSTRHFEGKISRSARLSDVLQILELSNVKFKMVGNNIIVQ